MMPGLPAGLVLELSLKKKEYGFGLSYD